MIKASKACVWGLAFLAAAVTWQGGCSFGGANKSPEVTQPKPDDAQASVNRFRRLRPPINPSRNLYEGSLWRGAASWGNLLRDHRARFRGDLLTVMDLQKIIKVPESKPEQAQTIQQQQQLQQQQQQQQPEQVEAEGVDPILAFLRRQERRRKEIDAEQNEILRSINSVEVQVVRVLSNGNMLVRGTHPPIFRDRNRVKYIVSITGIVRPSDVDETNNVNAIKLSKAEYKIRRLVRRDSIPHAVDSTTRRTEGALLDRLGSFIRGSGSQRQAAPPQTQNGQ